MVKYFNGKKYLLTTILNTKNYAVNIGTESIKTIRIWGKFDPLKGTICIYLQQSFFLTKMALKIFQKNCPIDLIAVIITELTTLRHSFQSSTHLQ